MIVNLMPRRLRESCIARVCRGRERCPRIARRRRREPRGRRERGSGRRRRRSRGSRWRRQGRQGHSRYNNNSNNRLDKKHIRKYFSLCDGHVNVTYFVLYLHSGLLECILWEYVYCMCRTQSTASTM